MSSFLERLRAAHKRAKERGDKLPSHSGGAPPHIHVGSGGGAVVGTNARGVVKKTAPK
jgi:hypothetical protein